MNGIIEWRGGHRGREREGREILCQVGRKVKGKEGREDGEKNVSVETKSEREEGKRNR